MFHQKYIFDACTSPSALRVRWRRVQEDLQAPVSLLSEVFQLTPWRQPVSGLLISELCCSLFSLAVFLCSLIFTLLIIVLRSLFLSLSMSLHSFLFIFSLSLLILELPFLLLVLPPVFPLLPFVLPRLSSSLLFRLYVSLVSVHALNMDCVNGISPWIVDILCKPLLC